MPWIQRQISIESVQLFFAMVSSDSIQNEIHHKTLLFTLRLWLCSIVYIQFDVCVLWYARIHSAFPSFHIDVCVLCAGKLGKIICGLCMNIGSHVNVFEFGRRLRACLQHCIRVHDVSSVCRSRSPLVRQVMHPCIQTKIGCNFVVSFSKCTHVLLAYVGESVCFILTLDASYAGTRALISHREHTYNQIQFAKCVCVRVCSCRVLRSLCTLWHWKPCRLHA